MERYDYYEVIEDDLKTFIEENYDLNDFEDTDEAYQEIYDNAFVSDSVTGNASGSYFCNTWKAEETLCHNLDLLGEALQEFGDDANFLQRGAEACDVTIRCYLLGQVLSEVLDELMEEREW